MEILLDIVEKRRLIRTHDWAAVRMASVTAIFHGLPFTLRFAPLLRSSSRTTLFPASHLLLARVKLNCATVWC